MSRFSSTIPASPLLSPPAREPRRTPAGYAARALPALALALALLFFTSAPASADLLPPPDIFTLIKNIETTHLFSDPENIKGSLRPGPGLDGLNAYTADVWNIDDTIWSHYEWSAPLKLRVSKIFRNHHFLMPALWENQSRMADVTGGDYRPEQGRSVLLKTADLIYPGAAVRPFPKNDAGVCLEVLAAQTPDEQALWLDKLDTIVASGKRARAAFEQLRTLVIVNGAKEMRRVEEDVKNGLYNKYPYDRLSLPGRNSLDAAL